MKRFKDGDIVKLNSGSCEMTVTYADDSTAPKQGIVAEWMDDEKHMQKWVGGSDCLMLVQPTPNPEAK